MIYIISGTNRPDSNTLKVSKQMLSYYQQNNVEAEIIDLQEMPVHELDGTQYSENKPQWIEKQIQNILSSDGISVVVPEYNGSLPGVLKLFIDHLEYPASFLHRPVSFVGLGGMFGGLRPVEHVQQIFGYRNAFIFPDRVFLMNIWSLIQKDKVNDPVACELMQKQAKDFSTFCKAIKNCGLMN